jgi:hypothetical protein
LPSSPWQKSGRARAWGLRGEGEERRGVDALSSATRRDDACSPQPPCALWVAAAWAPSRCSPLLGDERASPASRLRRSGPTALATRPSRLLPRAARARPKAVKDALNRKQPITEEYAEFLQDISVFVGLALENAWLLRHYRPIISVRRNAHVSSISKSPICFSDWPSQLRNNS